MAENAKIKIGFLYNTLYIYSKEMIQYLGNQEEFDNNSIEADLYNVLDIIKLYNFLTYKESVILNKWNIKIDDIIIIDNDKVAFKAALYIALKNIDLQKEILFDWKNITFKNTVNMIFNTKGMIVTMNKCEFQDDVDFSNSIFNKYANFSNSIFNKSANFRRAKFEKLVSFYGVTFSGDRADFSDCEFQGYVNFNNSKFEKSADFRGAKFEKAVGFYGVTFSGDRANFSNCEFQDDVYFNNSIFNKSANFRVANFEKVANFYGVTFNETPNFSQAIFNGSLNLVNTNLNFDFDSVKKRIIKECYNRNRNVNQQKDKKIPQDKQKVRIQTANDFRDSFRNFKSTLIKDNNLLDASNFHKVELYCKEIELRCKKPPIFSKDWIDLWQLKIYRDISDHHTNLLRSFHSLLMLIGAFVLLNALIIVVFNYYNNAYFEWNLHSMITFYDTHIRDSILSNSLLFFIINIALLIVFVALFLFGLFCELFRKVFIKLSYLLVIAILAISPKYLILTIEVFTNKREMLDPLSVIGGIYAILFGFMLFSFIKTIRKNSIIPN